MSLADDLREARKTLETPARILTFDIETARAIVEVFGLFGNDYIHMDRVKKPSRILCVSARWLGEGEEDGLFFSAWDDADLDSYATMEATGCCGPGHHLEWGPIRQPVDRG